MEIEDFVADVCGFTKVDLGSGVFRVEDVDLSDALPAVAVATACRLGDRVEPSHASIDYGEVDIDACFNELGRDQSGWKFIV